MPGTIKIPLDKLIEMGKDFQDQHPVWLQPWVVLEFSQKVKERYTMRNP